MKVTTEIPILLSYLHNEIVPYQSDEFCKFWSWQDYSFNVMILMLTAHTAIERYLMVFHRIGFRQHQLIVHYLPMIFCCIYPIVLYFSFIFFYPCTNQFDYTMVICRGPCYFYQAAISTFDQFINLVLPVVISSVACVTLLVRVIRQKQRMQQHQMWRKNRRLVIQLLYVIVLHNIIWLPMVVCSTIMFFSPISNALLVDLSINILPMGIYVVILLNPFISLMSLPELWPQMNLRIFPLVGHRRSTQQLPVVQTHATPGITMVVRS